MNQPVSLRGAPIGLIARLRLWLENYFGIHREGSTLRREIIAGATTFLAAAYVIVVNPDINAAAGIPFSAGVSSSWAPSRASILRRSIDMLSGMTRISL